MGIRALIIDREALSSLDAAFVEDAWFDDFAVPADAESLRRIEHEGFIFLLGRALGEESGLLVIDLEPSGPLLGVPNRRSAFERMLRVAMRHFDRSVALPIAWQAYHEDSLLSVFAQAPGNGARHRLYFDQAPAGDANIFAYAQTSEPQRLTSTVADVALYRCAVAAYQDAAFITPAVDVATGGFSIHLTQPLGFQLAGAGTLTEWYDHRLNGDQVRFVDRPTDRPVRLRGPAGTGKTQSMAVKCLRELYADHDAGGDRRVAFLTHSSALAHEVVRGMLIALDPTERFDTLRDRQGKPKLWLGTLYELAQEQLGYQTKGLRPLSLDGREGRELQRMLIDEAIEQVKRDPRVMLTSIAQSEATFRDRLTDEAGRAALVEELMNEFACVLDAENIKRGTEAAEKYIKGRREAWQMTLSGPAERQVALAIHHAYREALKREQLLSMDQMIADFDQYLQTHEWERLRDRDGFDVIFVDEYHYLTRVEAMLLHNLFKERARGADGLPLLMAYDLKQSTNDVALGGGLTRFRSPGKVGASIEVELSQVYRSTPEITAVLQALDAAFPAIDLEGEFSAYPGLSAKEHGPVPEVREYATNLHMLDDTFRLACQRARELPAGGAQVAVLCLNEERFDTYRVASRVQDKMVAITTREDLRELRYAKSKCVFSIPDYVAGLQFDTVLLIHADEVDPGDDQIGQGARRRYVSRVYLGASRAACRLSVTTSRERGGLNPIFSGAVQAGLLRQV